MSTTLLEAPVSVVKRPAAKKTMKAAVVHEFGKLLIIEEVPIPSPGPGEVLIKVIANGV